MVRNFEKRPLSFNQEPIAWHFAILDQTKAENFITGKMAGLLCPFLQVKIPESHSLNHEIIPLEYSDKWTPTIHSQINWDTVAR
jgi:hypothetical protein